MKNKRPIDIKRESSGSARIGSEEDGAIVEMIKIGKRLIVLKEKSIYEFMMADQVDPQRTNIKLPSNIHKLIIDKGDDSEMVSRIFLQANQLINQGEFDQRVDIEKVMNLVLDLLQEIDILESEILRYLEKEKEIIREYELRKNEGSSYSIPSIGNVKNRCTTIFQKADHIEQTLMKIIIIFYPDDVKQKSHFPKFYDVIKQKYGEKDSFTEFLEHIKDFMELVRNLRNALDHQLECIQIYDFELEINSNVIAPSIEFDFRGSKLERQSISEFLKILIPNFIYICEITIVHLAGHNFVPSFVRQSIQKVPEHKRRNKYVNYAYWFDRGFRD